jgi:AcrR family transcriptional regulator
VGLRERKALHTRTWIADTALDVFEEHGYEGTTLEELAARAGVSVSTLHRYFPTKDSLLVDHPSMEIGTLARAFRSRPASEPVAQALGAALLAFLASSDGARDTVRRVRALIDQVPVARAKMWDSTHRETALLAEAVRERIGADRPAEESLLAAEFVLTIVVVALQPAAGGPAGAVERGERLLEMLADPAVLGRIIPQR